MNRLTKRIAAALTAALLAAACAALLASCGGSPDYESSLTPSEVLERMISAAKDAEAKDGDVYLESGLIYRGDTEAEGEFLTPGQKSIFYGGLTTEPDFTVVENYAVWIAQDTVATELGVFKVSDKADAGKVEEFLRERIATLKGNAANYKPEEEIKAGKAVVVTRGRYVAYVVTNINDTLVNALETALTE